MKSLQKDLQAFVKDLKALALTTEKLSKKLAKLEPGDSPKAKMERPRRAAKPARPSGAGKTKKVTAVDAVLNTIKRSKKGTSMTQIKAKTGFNDRKIWNAIYQLKKDGKIKNMDRGIYVSS